MERRPLHSHWAIGDHCWSTSSRLVGLEALSSRTEEGSKGKENDHQKLKGDAERFILFLDWGETGHVYRKQ